MDRKDRTDRLPALALTLALLGAAACSSGDDDSADTLVPVPTVAAVTTTVTAASTTTVPTTPPSTTAAPTTTPPTTAATTTAAPTTAAPTRAAPTTAAATTTTAAAPTTTAPPVELALARNGLTVTSFGTAADATVAAVTDALGAPTEDSGWVEPQAISACAGTELRRVSWGILSMYLGDPSGAGNGTREFFTYSYGDVANLGGQPAGLQTPEGIGLGAPVADLRAAYPEVEIVPGEEGLIEPSFFVDDSFGGLLTGDTDTDSVTVMWGGPFCG